MMIEELERYVDHEVQWMQYYAFSDSIKVLNENSELYRDLVSIGYTKRFMPLDKRCARSIITSKTDYHINKDSSLDYIIIISESNNNS